MEGRAMRRIYCTFSGSMYDQTTQRIVEDAPKFGVDEVRVYDDRWLMDQEFYHLNRWIFDLKSRNEHRGFGWYCWKPFVILTEMERAQWIPQWTPDPSGPEANHAPVILFTDADTYPIGDLTPLFQRCKDEDGIMLFAAEGWTQGQSTKRDCMIAMGCDTDRVRHAASYRCRQHATARFALFEVGNWRAKQILMEWLAYCLNPLCVGLEPSVLSPEYPEYQEHRSDQSILTDLAHKYGVRLYREADQFGDGTDRDRDLYGTMFHQIGCYDQPRTLNGSKYRNV
jgi:hypothetical protein